MNPRLEKVWRSPSGSSLSWKRPAGNRKIRSCILRQIEQIEQNIQVEVRNALQGIRSAEARLRSAAIARENSEKQYESELRKFDEGQTDPRPAPGR